MSVLYSCVSALITFDSRHERLRVDMRTPSVQEASGCDALHMQNVLAVGSWGSTACDTVVL